MTNTNNSINKKIIYFIATIFTLLGGIYFLTSHYRLSQTNSVKLLPNTIQTFTKEESENNVTYKIRDYTVELRYSEKYDAEGKFENEITTLTAAQGNKLISKEEYIGKFYTKYNLKLTNGTEYYFLPISSGGSSGYVDILPIIFNDTSLKVGKSFTGTKGGELSIDDFYIEDSKLYFKQQPSVGQRRNAWEEGTESELKDEVILMEGL